MGGAAGAPIKGAYEWFIRKLLWFFELFACVYVNLSPTARTYPISMCIGPDESNVAESSDNL